MNGIVRRTDLHLRGERLLRARAEADRAAPLYLASRRLVNLTSYGDNVKFLRVNRDLVFRGRNDNSLK